MPYIRQADRQALNEAFSLTNGPLIETPGELNYILTKICLAYAGLDGPSYITYNNIIGVLECVKQEFYRRVVAPYEDKKMLENGDVYS